MLIVGIDVISSVIRVVSTSDIMAMLVFKPVLIVGAELTCPVLRIVLETRLSLATDDFSNIVVVESAPIFGDGVECSVIKVVSSSCVLEIGFTTVTVECSVKVPILVVLKPVLIIVGAELT